MTLLMCLPFYLNARSYVNKSCQMPLRVLINRKTNLCVP